MATTPGERADPRRLVMPVVTYAIVLAMIGGVGLIVWTGGTSGPRSPAPISKATPIEPFQAARVPARPPESGTTSTKKEPEEARVVVSSRSSSEPSDSDVAGSAAPTKKEPTREPPTSPVSSQSETSNSDAGAATTIQPEPPKNRCAAAVDSWPTDSTDQVKAIQILMRDLGFYGGTTYGTLGPTTRAAIRKFQLSAEHADTGEPSEMLFEALKKKCHSSAP